MGPFNRPPNGLAAFLLPLLAASLACSFLGGPAGPGSTNTLLTQAAATITAAANSAATAQTAVPTSAPSPSPSPLATIIPTLAPTPAPKSTTVPTVAASIAPTATPAAASTAQSGSPVVLDPCTLITAVEARALVGVDLQPARQQSSACVFSDQFAAHGLAVYALPPSQAQGFFQQFVASLTQSGVKIDPAAETKLNLDLAGGNLTAATDDLAGMMIGQTKIKSQKLDGLGSTALSLFNTNDQLHLSNDAVIAAQADGLVALSLVISTPAKEADMQASLRPFVSRILASLPPEFLVKGLQVNSSAPVIDPCALATDDEIQAIMGVKPGAGQALQGECSYNAASNHQILVRVFALPPGQGAAQAIAQLESLLVITDAVAKAKLTADTQAGDLVAVVKDFAALPPTMLGKPESVNGLGDAASFSLASPLGSPLRIGYLATAKPGVIIGITLLLGAGDSAAAKTASIALATKILKNLPNKFTVSGAP